MRPENCINLHLEWKWSAQGIRSNCYDREVSTAGSSDASEGILALKTLENYVQEWGSERREYIGLYTRRECERKCEGRSGVGLEAIC